MLDGYDLRVRQQISDPDGIDDVSAKDHDPGDSDNEHVFGPLTN